MDGLVAVANLFRKTPDEPVDYVLTKCGQCGTIYHMDGSQPRDTCPLCLGHELTETTVRELVEGALLLTKFQRDLAFANLSEFIKAQVKAGAYVVLVAKTHPDWMVRS